MHRCYKHKHNIVNFFNRSGPSTTDTVQHERLYRLQLMKWEAPVLLMSLLCRVLKQSSATQLYTKGWCCKPRQNVGFPRCVGPPQLIHCKKYYFIGHRVTEMTSSSFSSSPLQLCVEMEQCDTTWYTTDDFINPKLSFSTCLGLSQLILCINNYYIGHSNRKWKVLSSSERANITRLCVFPLLMLGCTMTHRIWVICSFWLWNKRAVKVNVLIMQE